MNITIISHYFYPEIGAPSARLKEMADAWVSEGHQVSVITNFPNHPTGIIHPGYKGQKFMIEWIEGLKIIRCRTFATPNAGFLKKIISHLIFMFNSVAQGIKHVKKSDVIIASSPTLFCVVSAWFISRRQKVPYIFEVRDLWPAIFVELGTLKNSIIINILEKLELFLYHKSAAVVTVTQSFAQNIITRGIDNNKVHFIPNGVDLTRFYPDQECGSLLRKQLFLQDKFIMLYIGAHGISHGLSSILAAAKLLYKQKNIHFLFVGEGAEKDKLLKLARDMQLKNITFLSGQPKNEMRSFYNLADACLVPLRNIPLFNTFIPSKIFEIMGCGRPILASLKGEAANILQQSGGAIIVPPENSNKIAKGILTLVHDNERCSLMGTEGRNFVSQNYDRTMLAKKYLKVMEKIAG